MLFAYIRSGRKALTLLDSQPGFVAKSLATGRIGCCATRKGLGSVSSPGDGGANRVEHDHVSIAMNVVHVYTHS